MSEEENGNINEEKEQESEKNPGFTSYKDMKQENAKHNTADEDALIRSTIDYTATNDAETDKEVQRYWSSGGSISGQAHWDKHHATIVMIEADGSGVLQNIALSNGGETRIYAQMVKVYTKAGYVIKGSTLRAARLK